METHIDDRRLDESRKIKAHRRWKLLINVLTKKQCTLDSSVSVRRFSSFGLLKTELLECDKETSSLESNSAKPIDKHHMWYKYTSTRYQNCEAHIRHLDGSINVTDMLGFNNTGNVCVWPSEEVLTHYCLKTSDSFRSKSVCELGGGMTCLAGVVLATASEASEVLLTDGNVNSVDNVKLIVNRNKARFGKTNVSARVLRWDVTDEDVKAHFDTVICADCLFFDEYRVSLANVIHHLLKPGGEAIVFAPSRGATFQRFMEILDSRFCDVVRHVTYDDHIRALHNENLTKGVEVYDPDLHYPMMLTFKKSQEKS